MAARDQELVECNESDWTELTAGDVTTLTFQVQDNPTWIRFTTGSAPASSVKSGLMYGRGQGEANVPVASLANLSGADRAFGRTVEGFGASKVWVDHA